ncbi:HD-GYP domain-containing protein [Thiobacillus sp.]
MLNAFYAMPLNAPLAFKLTVARERRLEIFEHSEQMTLIALILAIKSRLPERDLASVAAAGMLHDIGELHIDPVLLRPGHPLDPDAMRHIYAHPMTAYLILQTYPAFHPEISTAVFEHHERMDGSGYPRGLKGGEIGRIGQIVMLAEAVNGLFEKSWHSHGAARLAVMLKMNRRKFDPELINHLVRLLNSGERARTRRSGQRLVRVGGGSAQSIGRSVPLVAPRTPHLSARGDRGTLGGIRQPAPDRSGTHPAGDGFPAGRAGCLHDWNRKRHRRAGRNPTHDRRIAPAGLRHPERGPSSLGGASG